MSFSAGGEKSGMEMAMVSKYQEAINIICIYLFFFFNFEVITFHAFIRNEIYSIFTNNINGSFFFNFFKKKKNESKWHIHTHASNFILSSLFTNIFKTK